MTCYQFFQKKVADHDQTFNLVAKMETIQSSLNITANDNIFMMQFNISTTFLYGEFDKDIFMYQPEGFIGVRMSVLENIW